MKWKIAFAMILLGATLNAQDLAGTWLGIVNLPDGDHPLQLRFSQFQEDWKGKADLILDGVENADLSSTKVTGNQVEFSIKLGDQVIAFDGKADPKSIKGKVNFGSHSGDFLLTKIAEITFDDKKKLFGIYRLNDGEFVYIRTWDELGKEQLTAFHGDGKIRALYPRSATQYFSGPGILIPGPETSNYSFHKSTIEFSEGSQKKSGTRLETIREFDVEILNKDRRIPGSLVLPEGKGPFPAVVLVHGSGAVSRDFLGPLAYVFAQKGIAALTYDKRKDWLDASFEKLAEDAAAAFKYLHTRSEIDPRKVGYLGASQGGWIAPLASTLEPGASFLILFSAPAITPSEQEVMRTREEAKAQGASPEEVNKTVEGLRAQLAELRKEETRIEVEKQMNEWKAAGKSKELNQSGSDNPRFLLWYRSIMDYDPVPVLRNTKIPVFALYGDLDLAVPPKENIEPLRKYLNEAGNKTLEVQILPRANHVLLEAKTGSRSEFPHLNHFAPGLFELMTEWVLKISH